MKFLKTLLLFAVVGFILPSCSDDNNNNDNEYTQSLSLRASDSFISSYSIKDNTTYGLPGASLLLTVDYNNSTMQLNINSLQFDPAQQAISFELPATRFGYKDSGWELKPGTTFDINSGTHHTISNLNIVFNSRANGTQALVNLSFTVDENYEVCYILRQNVFAGTTKTFDINKTDDIFTTENPLYLVQLNADGKSAIISIANPQFVSNMPTTIQTMQFPGITVKYVRGGIDLECAKLTPTISETPYPRFEITDLDAEMRPGKEFDLNFKCMAFTRQVEFDGKPY